MGAIGRRAVRAALVVVGGIAAACGGRTGLDLTVRAGEGLGDVYESLSLRVLFGDDDWMFDLGGGSVSLPARARLELVDVEIDTAGGEAEVCARAMLGASCVEGCAIALVRPGAVRRVEVTLQEGCCGDGIVGAAEICEAGELGGRTCMSEGFALGTLACSSTCARVDTSGCSTCGNGVAETAGGVEVCDGADLAGATCAGAGWAGGTLACDASCAFETAACTGATVPHPRKPMNDADVGSVHVPGSLRPTFVWDPSSSNFADPITYELEYDTSPTFAAATRVDAGGATTFTPASDLAVEVAVPPVGARWYWRVRALAGEETSAWSAAWWVNVGRSRRDVNGDGYADVLAGAPGSNEYEGRVDLFFGGPAPDLVPDASTAGTGLNSFGSAGAIAGDVDGDAFADVVVGTAGGKSAWLFRGGAAGLASEPVVLAAAPGAPPDAFGFFVARAGDVNRDGLADIVIGAPGGSTTTLPGAAFLFLGSAGLAVDAGPWLASAVLAGERGADYFGLVVSSGDVNGDGSSDVVVGAPCGTPFYPSACQPGRAYVYLGGESASFDVSPDLVLGGGPDGDHFGLGVSANGDFDGDGFADVVVGAPAADTAVPTGAAFLYEGAPGGPSDVPGLVLPGGGWTDLFGSALAAGDLDGDGLDDLAIGAYYRFPGHEGEVEVHLSPLGTGVPVALTGTVPNGFFGYSLAVAGDVDGDAVGDLIAGGALLTSFPPVDPGRIAVFGGASAGSFSALPLVTATGAPGDLLGWFVD